MTTLTLSILTQEQTISTGQATSVTIPTEEGEITVLPGHINLFSKLKSGQLIVRNNDTQELLAVQGGFVDIGPTYVKILADTAIRADSINELKAQQAKQAAEEALKNKTSNQDYIQAQLTLQRALLELKTLSRSRHFKQ